MCSEWWRNDSRKVVIAMRNLLRTLLFLSFVLPAYAQAPNVSLQVRAILVDKDLNQKPVPRLSMVITPDSQAGAPTKLMTDFDGRTRTELAPGKYKLVTSPALEFQGKRLTWKLDIDMSGTEKTVVLSNDNAEVTEAATAAGAVASPDLSTLFKKYQNSVATVWSEFGHGTGFLVDSSGLFVTNQHVVGSSEYLAVQFDPQRKVAATLLASDPQKDIAVVWANLAAFPEAVLAPVSTTERDRLPAVEGQSVFTIGSPFDQQKLLTTGIVSKVDAHTIMSNININPGNSGGPLFNMAGDVLGVTTFNEQSRSGPGISGIVRIEDVLPLLEQARGKSKSGTVPAATLLPVEPKDPFPSDALKVVLKQEKFDNHPYEFVAADYNIVINTPPRELWNHEEERIKAQKAQEKRNKKRGVSQQATTASEDSVKDWSKVKPVIEIMVLPKVKEGFWAGMNRSMAAQQGILLPAKLRFKTDFYKMRLLCGEKEIQPIHPGKFPFGGFRSGSVNFTDTAFLGSYTYLPESIAPTCGKMSLEIYAGKNSQIPTLRPFDDATIQRVWADFEPYRNTRAGRSPEHKD
jgi:S1-C subfamily serine protease